MDEIEQVLSILELYGFNNKPTAGRFPGWDELGEAGMLSLLNTLVQGKLLTPKSGLMVAQSLSPYHYEISNDGSYFLALNKRLKVSVKFAREEAKKKTQEKPIAVSA